jgi:hypothetical protein
MVSTKMNYLKKFQNLMSRWMYTQDDNQRVYMSLILRNCPTLVETHWFA